MTRQKRKPPGGTGGERKALDNDDEDSSTLWRVVIASRTGRRIVWRRFGSRAGALAEARLLHARGIGHAIVEGPTS